MRVRIKFTEHTIFETEGPGRGPVFEVGRYYTMREDQAQKWIKREVAEFVEEVPDVEYLDPTEAQLELSRIQQALPALVSGLSQARGALNAAIGG
jgi:formylmethanofuran dehydrogenase subunit A